MNSSLPLLAVDLDGDGAHPAAWRDAGRAPGAVLSAAAVREAVEEAEEAGFAFATFADSPRPPSDTGLDAAGRLEAGTRAAFVATTTERLGLAPQLHVTTTEPFHLATQLASLDHASNGRAAWFVGAANTADDLATIGATPLPPDALRREVLDVVDVTRLLWDSWQDDAVIKDVGTGRYLDPDRVHHVDFAGASFTVKGPLITPRPPQGQVVVIAPDELGIADRADVVLITASDLADVAERAGAVREQGALAFVDVEVVLAPTAAGARLRSDELDAATPWPQRGLRHVGSLPELYLLVESLGGVVDGVRFLPAVQRVDGSLLASAPPPGRAPAPGATLRDTLGLARPVNHYVA